MFPMWIKKNWAHLTHLGLSTILLGYILEIFSFNFVQFEPDRMSTQIVARILVKVCLKLMPFCLFGIFFYYYVEIRVRAGHGRSLVFTKTSL